MKVSHYGIHWTENGIAFLEQGRSGTNAVGLKFKSPFSVELPSRRKHCNHQITLNVAVPSNNHWDYFQQLLSDDLVRAMLPIPKLDGGVYFFEESDRLLTLLNCLSRMTSPIHPIVIPIWTVDSAQAIVPELQSTNIQPLILTGCEPKHSSLLSDIAKAAVILPRKLVLSGSPHVIVPTQGKRVTTTLTNPDLINLEDFAALPWEQLGATVIRKFMRREFYVPSSNVQARTGGAAS